MNDSANILGQDDQVEIEETMTPLNTSISFDLHRNDSQTDLNKYIINYVDDTPNQPNSKSFSMNENLNTSNKYSSRLEVSQLPDEIFTDENIQSEFECIFHEFDPNVEISYSNLQRRIYLTFSDPILAYQVSTYMNEKEFHGEKLNISYAIENALHMEYLKLPSHERIYMQSPPTTPPVGWTVQREDPPEINLDIFLALSKLQPDEPLEILAKQNHLPAIIIHPCSDSSDDDLDDTIHPIIDEYGHRKYSTVETKRRSTLRHDTSHTLNDSPPIRHTFGDGDKPIFHN